MGEEDCRSLTDEEIQRYKDKYSEPPVIDDEETAADVGFKFIGFWAVLSAIGSLIIILCM